MIYATFPFLLPPLCQITDASLTSLIFTLHTLHSIRGGGFLAGYFVAQFRCQAESSSTEMVRDDGGETWLLCSAGQTCLTEACRSSRSLQPTHTGQMGEAAGDVGTHTIFTIGKHTLRQNRHAQYHILFSYQAASVSWSLEPLLNSTEPHWRSWTVVEPSSYSYGNGSSFPSGSQGNPGPLAPIASLQLL